MRAAFLCYLAHAWTADRYRQAQPDAPARAANQARHSLRRPRPMPRTHPISGPRPRIAAAYSPAQKVIMNPRTPRQRPDTIVLRTWPRRIHHQAQGAYSALGTLRLMAISRSVISLGGRRRAHRRRRRAATPISRLQDVPAGTHGT
jgi:hypothetical protein